MKTVDDIIIELNKAAAEAGGYSRLITRAAEYKPPRKQRRCYKLIKKTLRAMARIEQGKHCESIATKHWKI